MDYQKELELFLDYYVSDQSSYIRDAVELDKSFHVINVPKLLAVSGLAESYVFRLKDSWNSWVAAKAQAVPEGFVLVKRVHPDAIVHNQGLGLFKECQVIYGWDGKSKDFKDALNKGFYHGVKLGAKAVLETAMIEAQEPTND